jgi:hypothetical protein
MTVVLVRTAVQYIIINLCSRILAENGSKPMTVYLIHSLSLLMSAVQIFCGEKMAVVAHLVGLEQLGYETDLGLTTAVRKKNKFD